MHFSLVKMNPPDALPSHGFDDAILPLYYALQRLGYDVEILLNRCNPRSRNIVFGSCIAPRRIGRELPPRSILFNLEQMTPDSKWCNRDYLAHLRDFPVWDYSAANVEALLQAGIADVTHVPLGYVPEMTRLRTDFPKAVDLLFYGLITDRRHQILSALLEKNVKVLATQEAFGDLRDKLLASSRAVLNVHSYLPAKLEIVRLGYVWANKIAVLSEVRYDSEVPSHLSGACLYAPYSELPEAAARILADPVLLEKQACEGFSAFASRPMEDGLEELIGRRAHPTGDSPLIIDSQSSDVAKPYHLKPVREWLINGSE